MNEVQANSKQVRQPQIVEWIGNLENELEMMAKNLCELERKLETLICPSPLVPPNDRNTKVACPVEALAPMAEKLKSLHHAALANNVRICGLLSSVELP